MFAQEYLSLVALQTQSVVLAALLLVRTFPGIIGSTGLGRHSVQPWLLDTIGWPSACTMKRQTLGRTLRMTFRGGAVREHYDLS
jgi:hypothetical protein